MSPCFKGKMLLRASTLRDKALSGSALTIFKVPMKAVAFFDGDGDVDGFSHTVGGEGDGHAKFVGRSVDIFENGFFDVYLEVSVVLIKTTYAYFNVFG